MTDRKLLELAAKAAVIEITCENSHSYPERIEYFKGLPNYFYWNPLTDDGDALLLAVKLGIAVDPRDYEVSGVCAITEDGILCVEDPRSQEPDVATRRAIVRAAAEIGKSMQ